MGRTLIVVGLRHRGGRGADQRLGCRLGGCRAISRIRRGNFSFYFPLATSIIVSVVLTLVLMFLGAIRRSAARRRVSGRENTMPSIKADRWIKQMALEHSMIEPFEDRQVRTGVISYGLSIVRLRHPRRRRVQDLHQHQQHGGRPEELRRPLVRRLRRPTSASSRRIRSRSPRRSSTSAFRATS